MIITSGIKLEVGRIYTEKDIPPGRKGFEYLDTEIQHFAFRVVRESNEDEFTTQNLIHYPEFADRIIHHLYFYEIQTD